MQWTPETISAIAAAFALALGAMFSKNVVDAFIRFADWWADWREKRLAEKALDDDLTEKGHKFIIRRLDRRVTDLEAENDELREVHNKQYAALALEHNQCRQEYAVLRVEYDRLKRRVEYLEAERRAEKGKGATPPPSDSDSQGLQN